MSAEFPVQQAALTQAVAQLQALVPAELLALFGPGLSQQSRLPAASVKRAQAAPNSIAKTLFNLSLPMQISYPTLIAATTLALLTACAAPTSTQANATAQTEPATITVVPAVFKEGTVAEFSKTESALDKVAIANISQNIDAYKKAKWIEVTGYCDRKDNAAGAQKLAMARADAVKAELIKQGVPSKKIYLKYALSQARHSASVVLK